MAEVAIKVKNKPFCDKSHRRLGFVAASSAAARD